MADRSSTHAIEVRSDVVVKRFRSWSMGQPEREWRALTLLSEYAPGLAPDPVTADLVGDPPRVVMSRLIGTPLAAPVTAEQLIALADAIRSVQEAIPAAVLADLPPRLGRPSELLRQLRARCDARPALGSDPLVAQAFHAAVGWLPEPRLTELFAAEVVPVFGLGDGNLANYLWDGSRVRLLDFEYSGRSDRAYELAEVVEHVTVWVDDAVDVPALLSCFDLTAAEQARLRNSRRLLALFWFLALLPDSPGHRRNPSGSLERQAARLLALLG